MIALLGYTGAALVMGLILAGCLVMARRDTEPYDPSFADPPLDVQRARLLDEVGPAVVAGSDLDLCDARVNLLFAVQILPYADAARAYEARHLELYGVPEVER